MTGPHRGERERIKVLAGVKVVEIGGMGPGPFAGMMLADHGVPPARPADLGRHGSLRLRQRAPGDVTSAH